MIKLNKFFSDADNFRGRTIDDDLCLCDIVFLNIELKQSVCDIVSSFKKLHCSASEIHRSLDQYKFRELHKNYINTQERSSRSIDLLIDQNLLNEIFKILCFAKKNKMLPIDIVD